MSRLRQLLGPSGQLITYDSDRAALDLGLQLYEATPSGEDANLGQVRVWFQAKGIEASTLGVDEIRGAADVVVKGLSIDQLRYWFSHPKPVYLVIYLGAT